MRLLSTFNSFSYALTCLAVRGGRFELFHRHPKICTCEYLLKPEVCTNLRYPSRERHQTQVANVPFHDLEFPLVTISVMEPRTMQTTTDNLSTTPKPNGTIQPKHTTPSLTPKLVPIHVIIFASYPITVLLGFLSNHPPESYFSRKNNIINVLFLKYAWGWTSIAFFIHVARIPQKVAPLARYMIATVWWYLVTQWCFGPPIMDKARYSSCLTD